MRLRQRPSPLFLFLIPALHLAFAFDSTDVPGHKINDYGHDVAALAEGKAVKQQELGADAAIPTQLPGSRYDTAFRAKDAPIDGKDGRPHTGPFVETSAERDRKKAKESGDDEKLSSSEKLLSKPIPSGTPDTNDGVMDDPYRKGPKEGTRGTEGGISEKSREKEGQLAGIGTDEGKKPDPPKEVPPLPHSEQEKVGTSDSGKKTLDPSTEDNDKQKEKQLGGLEVGLPALVSLKYRKQQAKPPTPNRNPKISPTNHTTFPIPSLPARPRTPTPSPSSPPSPPRSPSSPLRPPP